MTNHKASEKDRLVVEVLRGDKTAAVASREAGVADADIEEWRQSYLTRKLPAREGETSAPVKSRIEIIHDKWGIPHIFGGSLTDALFALGFLVGQERLWQIEHRRRGAYGTLSEVLGPSFIEPDFRARLVNAQVIAERDLGEISQESKDVLQAYSDGINHAVGSFSNNLPVEFDVLDYTPSPWSPLDILTIMRFTLFQFSGRIENIVLAEAAMRYLPENLAQKFLSIEADDETIVPATGASSPAAGAPGDDATGSNSWSVGPSKSANGGAMLASDGHVPYSQPSGLFEVHLSCPDFDFIGIHAPGVIQFNNGRTRHVAWGVTNNVSSARDLYVEEPHPQDSNLYRDGDEWREYDTRTEVVNVKGASPVERVMKSTVRGIIVNDIIPSVAAEGDPPLSMRYVAFNSMDIVKNLIDGVRARSAEEYRQVQLEFNLATSNSHFADADGHFGYQMRGNFPIRERVVRGYRYASAPEDAWQRVATAPEFPYEMDTPRGWTMSANNPPVGADYPIHFYGAFADGYRYRRIRTRLDGSEKFVLEAMGQLQYDSHSLRAADVAPDVVKILESVADERVKEALSHLAKWDYAYEIDSVASSIFEVFWWKWTQRVAGARFPEHLHSLATGGCSSIAHWLITEGNDGWFESDDKLHEEVRAAFNDALDWLNENLGGNSKEWGWGKLHPITLRHNLAPDGSSMAEVFNVGPYPCAGVPSTPNAQGYSIRSRFETVSGPHYRFLADLSNPNLTLGCNTTGNSGHPASEHYRDQTEDWLAGRYHPLYMDRADIEANAEGTMWLMPS